MDGTTGGQGVPRRIMLATDLSARCDRALDRAAQLATQWGADLVVVHAIEDGATTEGMSDTRPGEVPADPVALARRQLIRDVGAVAERAMLLIERGRPADAIIRAAEREGCDLIVLGIARDELFGRHALGTTVDRLMRGAPAPLLVVRNRPRQPYSQILVASDFSEPARGALVTAFRFFPDRRLTLFHAFDPPLENRVNDRSGYLRDSHAVALGEALSFIAGTPRPDGTPEPEPFVTYGHPADALLAHVRDEATDLVVLGPHGRTAISEFFVGSVAKRVLDHVPCDCLLVRAEKTARET